MREDMFKVIVERPRHGRYWHRERAEPRDLESAPDHEGLRVRHLRRKSLNENLRPLERFLAAQVGRPWDKVYGEICANIDRRSTVQQHIHQHLADFVAIRVVDIGGVLHDVGRWSWPRPLEERWAPKFWVDPRTGLLRRNSGRTRARTQSRQAREDADRQRRQHRRDLGPWRQLQYVHGNWFEVELAPIPPASGAGAPAFDVLRRAPVADGYGSGLRKGHVGSDEALYGRDGVYAFAKRQLSARELRHHGLVNRDDGA